MNLAIFVTNSNLPTVEAFCERSATLQQTTVNGALCVVHQAGMSLAAVSKATASFAPRFKVQTSLPVQVNLELPEDARIAAMFARFLLGAYARFPGPWLVVDQWAMPLVPEFMVLARQQHAAFGGRMTGRGVATPGAILPVGPVVMELPAQTLKFLRFSSRESWRSRGRYHFGRCGFGMVQPDQYLFSVSEDHSERSEFQLELPTTPVAPPPVTQEARQAVGRTNSTRHGVKPLQATPRVNTDMTFVNPSLVKRQPAIPEGVVLDREFLSQGLEPVAPVNPQPTKAPASVASTQVTKAELLDQVQTLTGTRPHHFTSEAKLRELLTQQPV